jgi:hypothetical protein
MVPFSPLIFLPLLLLLIPVATIITTYLLAWKEGHIDGITFISATLEYPLESCIGSFGLSVTAAIFIIVLWLRFQYIYGILRRQLKRINSLIGQPKFQHVNRKIRINTAALVFGLFSAISLIGTVSFQFHNSPAVHLTMTFFFFYCGITYMFMVNALDHQIRLGMQWLRIMRWLCALVAALMMFPGAIFVGIHLWWSPNIDWPVTVSATCEIVAVLAFLCFFSSFCFEFAFFRVNFEIQHSQEKDTSVHEQEPLVV